MQSDQCEILPGVRMHVRAFEVVLQYLHALYLAGSRKAGTTGKTRQNQDVSDELGGQTSELRGSGPESGLNAERQVVTGL